MPKMDLKTKEITVVTDDLAVNRDLNTRDWKCLKPQSIVAQASDGATYFAETGITTFSVLPAQS